MVATVGIDESNTGAETVTHGITNMNFGNTDATSLTTSDFPITAGYFSYCKYFRINVTGGTYNKIDNIKVWKSSGGYQTGEGIYSVLTTSGYSSVSYATPTTNSYAGNGLVPESVPASQNIGVGASGLTGYLSGSATNSDYIKMIMSTSASTPAGNVTQKVFTFQYDEQ